MKRMVCRRSYPISPRVLNSNVEDCRVLGADFDAADYELSLAW